MSVNVKCTIQSKHAKVPSHNKLSLVVKQPTELEMFILRMSSEKGIPWHMTVHRSKKNKATGELGPGEEIIDENLVLEESETIFIIFDENFPVTRGGGGEGAKAHLVLRGSPDPRENTDLRESPGPKAYNLSKVFHLEYMSEVDLVTEVALKGGKEA
ncbi:hypothetical protein diail_4538 [Diaporthe ilicicola]|nr:hypothetical protein diail_4538 [Diaporthe ilicicola]